MSILDKSSMEIICYIKKKRRRKIQFSKKKNRTKVTLFTVSRGVKAGRKFARPQPLCRAFDRAFRPASPDKTVPASIFPSAPFVIDIIVIFSINLVPPSTRYSSATRVSSSARGIPMGRKGEEEREREERERRKEIRERTSEDSYFPSRWMKRRGEGGGVRVAESISEKASGRPLSGREHEKTFCSTLASSARAVSIDICHTDPLSIQQSNDSWFLLAAKLCDALIKVGFRNMNACRFLWRSRFWMEDTLK